jgi:hypothetical protein
MNDEVKVPIRKPGQGSRAWDRWQKYRFSIERRSCSSIRWMMYRKCPSS